MKKSNKLRKNVHFPTLSLTTSCKSFAINKPLWWLQTTYPCESTVCLAQQQVPRKRAAGGLWTDIKKKLLVREALPPRKFLPFGVWDFVVRQMKQPERFIVPRGRSTGGHHFHRGFLISVESKNCLNDSLCRSWTSLIRRVLRIGLSYVANYLRFNPGKGVRVRMCFWIHDSLFYDFSSNQAVRRSFTLHTLVNFRI